MPGELIGRAVRELKNVTMLDEEAGILADQLLEIDNLLNDFTDPWRLSGKPYLR